MWYLPHPYFLQFCSMSLYWPRLESYPSLSFGDSTLTTVKRRIEDEEGLKKLHQRWNKIWWNISLVMLFDKYCSRRDKKPDCHSTKISIAPPRWVQKQIVGDSRQQITINTLIFSSSQSSTKQAQPRQHFGYLSNLIYKNSQPACTINQTFAHFCF